jgi:hypothetical protein
MRTTVVGVLTALVMAVVIVLRMGGGLSALALGGHGTYAFMSTQQGHPNVPVTYSSCRPVRVQFNLDGVEHKDEMKQLLLDAMGEASAASHLNLVYAGPSTRRPDDPTPSPDGRAWPVLIVFTDDDEVPGLKGNDGLGGSTWTSLDGGPRMYVTGQVSLARDDFNNFLVQPGGHQEAEAIVMHELGHVLGLAHVHDGGELMSADDHGRHAYGPGDLRGLVRLGSGPCN